MNNSIFLNVTNHPSSGWSTEQLEAAQGYGKVMDMPYPVVPTKASAQELESIVADLVATITEIHPEMCLIQGEMTTLFKAVTALKESGIQCCSSISERNTEDLPDGRKIVRFVFEGFRPYF